MKQPSDDSRGLPLRERLIGLGERSHRKSYYPELRQRAAQLERFRVLLDEAQDGIVLLESPAWTIVDLNEAGRRLFSATAEAAPGAAIVDVVAPAARAQLAESLRAAEVAASAPFTLALPGAGGERHLELTARPATFEGRAFLVLGARDVTARVEAERALRDSERRFRALFENAPDAIFLCADDGSVIDANPEASRSLGYSAAELRRMKVHEFDDDATPGHSCRAREAAAAPITFTAEHRRRDGSTFPVEVRLAALPDGTGLAVVRDLSERVRMEEALRTKERQFLQAQKMEAIGQLAGGVAHDFNNLLTVMLGYIDLILEQAGPDVPLRDDAAELLQATRRAADLTRQLLAFGRKQIMQPRVVSLNEIVSGLERMLRRLITENIVLETELAADLWPVRADPGQLEQVVVNLAINARDAMPNGGALRIGTRNVAAAAGLDGQPLVELTVSDTGLGMDAATRARVFEPFFTTKEPGKGTGLGLATVHGIVLQSGGDVTVESEEGQGTTFRIALPRAETAPESQRPSLAHSVRRLERGSILVVEDDAAVRKLIVHMLSRGGFAVLEAGSFAEAERLCASAGAIDLLLCDAVLPDLDGHEAAGRLLALRPRLRVLFMSGYGMREGLEAQLQPPRVGFIAKPFAYDDLVDAVRAALERPSKPAPPV